MENEEWRDVVGYEGFFEVSNYGRVRSVPRLVERSNGHKFTVAGRIRKQLIDINGYPVVGLTVKGRKFKSLKVANLVAKAFIGPQEKGMDVCHRDGSRDNSRLDNLYYGTRKENAEDMIRHGTDTRGEKNAQAKITNEQAREIVALRGVKTLAELSQTYGLEKTAVCSIQKGRSWSHATGITYPR